MIDEIQDTAPFGYTPDGSPRRSGYFAVIGASPDCAPADYKTALAYLHLIEKALQEGGWTQYEFTRLNKLRAKWARRALGKDPRFDLVGTRAGRLPADVEYRLKGKQRKAWQADEAARRRKGGKRRKVVMTVNADLPSGQARGRHASPDTDPENDVFEAEAGEIALPPAPAARQYLIPGQDTKGHTHRIYCRIMPAHHRAIAAVERSKEFGFRTIGDVMRWCIDYGVRELAVRARVPQARSALAQVDAIREVLLDEQYYLEFPTLFEQMTTTINRHLSAGAEGEAVRLIAIVRNQIEQMGEEYWREKYMAELMRHYGSYLDGSRAASASVEFGGG
jgi:hypothetical protein